MSFDGLFTYAITNELQQLLLNGRISRIYQPFQNELILQIRSQGKNHKLLISAHPTYARIHLTEEQYNNPPEPPMFCMLLRKHIEGSIIQSIRQVGLDRIMIIELKGKNEIGDVSHKQLIIELMGRHSNIILVDKDEQVILDSIKHITPALNRHRTILPGFEYVAPPSQDKENPFSVTEDRILKKLDFNAGKLDQQLVNTFAGVSPMFAKEVMLHAGIANRNSLPKAFMTLILKVKNMDICPQITRDDSKESFYLFPLDHIKGEVKTYSSLSTLLDRYYYGKADRERVRQRAVDLERFIDNEKKKNEKKIKKLTNSLNKAKNADQYKLLGELLTANIFMVNQGDSEVDVVNYYDENRTTITIPLDPRKTPADNAQSYYTKYQKAKKSIAFIHEQISHAEEEVIYFDSLKQQIQSATASDIEEIREELVEGRYIRSKKHKGQKKNKLDKPQIERYKASDGTEILVGKNNKQNDYLTSKVARKEEVWLHTKDIPGSHVVIRHDQPSDQTILEAANLAAYFSKAKHSSSVPVDYTKIRNVKKPNGSKPGYVIYDNQQTVFVTPDEDLLITMRV
ncbi:NFACT family protein [Cytobacillus sp. IB215316]|uniref:Rqc2 family fibronectin-binding protein n=1 Tax=Cytobacillus sp. IB215316 TaxID=3097354 RepID=UPI002A105AFE|nr:NFACT RNA binding domain-containing protein [Cytobacillus sp. IB215316]MDX8362312.1 NFACT RNA binding domain-containing protein [Cytobacillus sp. IB215316]